jgi:phosphoribosylamine--glycine ligase
LEDAIKASYETVKTVNFENAYYRKDIGKRALAAKVN